MTVYTSFKWRSTSNELSASSTTLGLIITQEAPYRVPPSLLSLSLAMDAESSTAGNLNSLTELDITWQRQYEDLLSLHINQMEDFERRVQAAHQDRKIKLTESGSLLKTMRHQKRLSEIVSRKLSASDPRTGSVKVGVYVLD